MAETRASEEKELDLSKLLSVCLRYLWLIALFACAGFFAVRIYLISFTPNLYTASATMYVYLNNPNQVNYQYTSQSDLNTAARLTETYMVVIRSSKVMNAVAERLGPEYDADFISRTISAGSVAKTEVMRVSSTTPFPELSMAICNAVAEFAPAEIIRVVNAGSVEVIDYATLPQRPNDKGVFNKSLIGAFAGALLVVGTLTLEVLFDDRVYTKADLKKAFDIPVLVSIPRMRRRALFSFDGFTRGEGDKKRKKSGDSPAKGGKAPNKARKSAARANTAIPAFLHKTPPSIVELYKRLRVHLSYLLGEKGDNVFLITSAVPGEGKSSTSASLAIVASQVYSSVLLIDADMRKVKRSRLSAPESGAPGLSSVLLGEESFDKAILKNACKGLDVLLSGPLPPNPAELIDSPEMKELLQHARARYDLVIIDTPPVNMVADALSLSEQVAGAICVVRSRLSTVRDITEAVNLLTFTHMPILGFVMTDTPRLRGKTYQQQNRYYTKYNEAYRRAAHGRRPLPQPSKQAIETKATDGDTPQQADNQPMA